MRIVIIGSGAREHALAWKLTQSRRVTHLYAAPGNPGIAELGECVPIGVTQLDELTDFAERRHVDLTVVGPETPLIDGIADRFRQRGLPIFGPAAAGAQLEGSKAFAKELMAARGIPTAQHRTFTNARDALAYLEEHGAPVVVKADGNAAGKGAIVALDMQTAREAVREMMIERVFGAAGNVVVIEDYVQGDEIGSTAICNGTHYFPLTLTQDHKRALDDDQGLNTGGMGAYTPLAFVGAAQERRIYEQIIAPTLNALHERGIAFSGVLYSNIMLTERGPVVLEHNTRFGDPETQALMLLLKADLLDILSFAERPSSPPGDIWHSGSAVSLTLASGGYPGKYRTGIPITGIAEAESIPGVQVFHAGTALQDGTLVTAGGRVLSVAAHGQSLQEAVQKVYEAAARISFEGMHYRKDIAKRGLQ
ncbi:MAG TPA: phosphoribosylamine--glycine ligase [Ktedonobacteraceae bacterium]|nr:phosphoribosylamine--glycine ligase [Ktedonobacteraceae bacterium]